MTTEDGRRDTRRGKRVRATACIALAALAASTTGCARSMPVPTSPARATYIAVASVEIGAVITALGYMGCRTQKSPSGSTLCKPWLSLLAGLAATGGTAASMAYYTGPEPTTTDWAMLSLPAAAVAGMGGYELVKYLRSKPKKKPGVAAAPPIPEPGLPRIIEWRRARFTRVEAAVTFMRRLGPSCLLDDGALYDLEQNADTENVQMTVDAVPGSPSAADVCTVVSGQAAPRPLVPGVTPAPPLATSELAVLFRVSRPFFEVKPGASPGGQPRVELWRARFTTSDAAANFANSMPPSCVVGPDELRSITTPARDVHQLETVAPLPAGAGGGEVVCVESARDGAYEVLFGWRQPPP